MRILWHIMGSSKNHVILLHVVWLFQAGDFKTLGSSVKGLIGYYNCCLKPPPQIKSWLRPMYCSLHDTVCVSHSPHTKKTGPRGESRIPATRSLASIYCYSFSHNHGSGRWRKYSKGNGYWRPIVHWTMIILPRWNLFRKILPKLPFVKLGHPNRTGSSSNHPFSGANMLVSGRVIG